MFSYGLDNSCSYSPVKCYCPSVVKIFRKWRKVRVVRIGVSGLIEFGLRCSPLVKPYRGERGGQATDSRINLITKITLVRFCLHLS